MTDPSDETYIPNPTILDNLPNIVPRDTYKAKVGCWNCNSTYVVQVIKGELTPQYLHDNEIPCKTCGCDTLKMYSEYKIERSIMKDVMLHHRVEHMHNEEDEKPPKDNDHYR